MVQSMKVKLSREPVLKGLTYCSPACGCGCTKAQYDEAVKRGVALQERMGEGWELRVWENFGWHSAVHRGVAQLYPPHKTQPYQLYLFTFPQVVLEGDDPKELLKQASIKVHERIALTLKELAEVEGTNV